MSSRIRTVASREPVSLAFCCLSFIGLVLLIAVPAALPYIALFPEDVIQRGHLWALISYAALPGNVIHLLLIAAAVLRLGWYLEPVFGRVRYLALLVGAAFGSGVMYVALQPARAPPLIGGLFVASAVASAFIVWSVPRRAHFGAGLKLFWALVALWAAYTLWASPIQLSAVHVVAWAIGALVAFTSIGRVRSSPNNAIEPRR
jgi:membrane associated rhomboid family serine protease